MESLRAAWAMFVAEKIRFILTISGIVVGVASLILLASLLAVGEKELQKSSNKALGHDLVTVSNDWQTMEKYDEWKRLHREDMEALQQTALIGDNVVYTPLYGGHRAVVKNGQAVDNVRAFGILPNVLDMYGLKIGQGRAFLTDEYDRLDPVALVGAQVLKGKLKPGDRISVSGKPVTIVGVLQAKPSMGPDGGGFGWDNRLLLPARLYSLEFNPNQRPANIVAQVSPIEGQAAGIVEEVERTKELMRIVLMQSQGRKHQTFEFTGGDGGGSDTEKTIFMVIKTLIYLTTVFSMIVGGINIMNIMLVTVTERTREIGIRRALGATQRDILRQFLAETLAVTLLGAVIGALSAVGLLGMAAWALTKWVTEWPWYVSPWSVAVGMTFSAGIGLVFGLIPAVRASRLDPMEALRYD